MSDMLSPTFSETRALLNLIDTHNLQVVSLEPSNHCFSVQPPPHKALDLFTVKNFSSVKQLAKSSKPYVTSHDFIGIQYSIDIRRLAPTVIRFRQLNRLSSEHLSTDLMHALEGCTTDDHTHSNQHDSHNTTSHQRIVSKSKCSRTLVVVHSAFLHLRLTCPTGNHPDKSEVWTLGNSRHP